MNPNIPVDTATATWSIHLFTDCPGCEDSVDLLDLPDFWDGHRFQPGEHLTPQTTGVEVTCPKCGHEFKCDLVC